MSKIGVICPPLWGHLNPMLSLAKELNKRSHQVIFYQIPELENKITSQGLIFSPIGKTEYSSSFLQEFVEKLGNLKGLDIIRYWYQEQERMTKVIFTEMPSLIQQADLDLLLVDQVEASGQAVAEYLDIPFVTICNALALNREPSIPPVFTPWTYQRFWWGRLRNQLFYYLGDSLVNNYKQLLRQYRKQWNLPNLPEKEILFANSKLAQISQQPSAFDFPRTALPGYFHYCGPFRDRSLSGVSFPYERLNGKPLIYASLGTLQTHKKQLFFDIASACQGLDVQLIIAHGGGLNSEDIANLSGTPLAVSYAPQQELLSRASLTITHAGLNTVLDSLSHGVPLVALPIGFEQPTIASRIQWLGLGEVIPAAKLKKFVLRATIQKVLTETSYRKAAEKVQNSIQQAGGIRQAADLIEKILATGTPVFRNNFRLY